MRIPITRIANETGVTLFETLIAAIMSGVLLSAAMPSLSTALNAHQIQSALRSTTNHVRVARSVAVARNTQTRMIVGDNGTTLTIEALSGGSWAKVGSPLVLEGSMVVSAVSPVSGLVFNPQGTTNASTTITLQSSRGNTKAVTVSILGAVGVS